MSILPPKWDSEPDGAPEWPYEILVRFSENENEEPEIVYLPIMEGDRLGDDPPPAPKANESNGAPDLGDWLRRSFDL